MARSALEAVFGALGGGFSGYARDQQVRYGQEQDALEREEQRLARELAARQSAEQRKISLFQSGLEEAAPLTERAGNMGRASQAVQAVSQMQAPGMPVGMSAVSRALSGASSGMQNDISRGRKLSVDGTDYVQPFSRTPDGRAERERMQSASDERVANMEQRERDDRLGKQRLAEIRLQNEGRADAGDRVSAATVKGLASGAAQLDLIQQARQALQEYPNAVGLERGLSLIPGMERIGDVVNQRRDPEGTRARQLLANLASMEIKDRSGAAVTVSEFPRLAPFIPNAYDTPEKVFENLDGLERELRVTLDALAQGSSLAEVMRGGGPQAQPAQGGRPPLDSFLRRP